MLDDLIKDLRYSARMLLNNLGFTAVAVLSLALGIGINTTIFSVVNAVLLKPLPVMEPDQLVEVYMSDSDGYPYSTLSYPDYRDIRDDNDVFSGLIASELTFYHFSLEDVTEMVFGEAVTGNYFDVLGVPAAMGRTFSPEEYRNPGTHPVVVLGHGFWKRRFAADPEVIGNTIKLNGHTITVIGVAPESFTGTIPVYAPDIWTTMSMQTVLGLEGPDPEALEERGRRSLLAKGRLRPGVTIEQAEAELNIIMARLGEAYPRTNEDRTAHLLPTNDVRLHPFVDEAATPVAVLLMVVVGMVLLIACANVANMLLAKASVRRQEMAVRLAVGASRTRLLRQLLTESIILALIGGALGMLLAYWCVNLIYVIQPPMPISIALDLGIDVRVLLFTLLVSLITGIFFGLAPGLQASRHDLVSSLKDETYRGGASSRRLSLRNILVVTQVAVSLVLLIAAGLFLRSVRNAYDIDPGFVTEKIGILMYNLGLMGYSHDQRLQFAGEARQRVASLPGVESAATAARVPVGFSVSISGLVIEGHELPPGEDNVGIDSTSASPGYFETMGVPLVAGRDFTDADSKDSVPVVIINEAMARRYWPGENPLGKRLRTSGNEDRWYEVVGVCRDYKVRTLGEEPRPYVHWVFDQRDNPFQVLLARTAGDPAPMLEALRRELRSIEPGLVFMDVRTMPENLVVTLYPVQVGATLLSVFGFLALGMAGVGLYGVIAYSVSRRTHEFGLRMALGARSADVLRLVVRQGMILVAVGIGLGMVGAAAVTWVLSSVLYGVSALDPVTFGATSLFLAAVAFLANWIPAHRAANIDPMTALRYE